MDRGRRLGLGATAAVAALSGIGWALWRETTPAPADDDFWGLRFDRPEGGVLELAPMRGRILVVNFWATWCPPCIRELPELDRLQQERGARGVQVVGLAVDSPAPVREFLAKHPVRFPIGLAGFEGVDLSRRLGNAGGALPYTVVFDRDGRRRHQKLGETDLRELMQWVDGL